VTPTDYLRTRSTPLVGSVVEWVEWVQFRVGRSVKTFVVGIVRGVTPDLTTLIVEVIGDDELRRVVIAGARSDLVVRVVHDVERYRQLARKQIRRARR
jgi:hypothetical protein